MSDNERLRVLVVDDEPLARRRIEDLLRRQPEAEVVGASEDGVEAVEAIRELRPDLVFLDVQMPGMSGLDVVSEVGQEMPATVFVTAYDRHALKAFELAAVDYLLKPFDDERFAQAFRRARDRVRLQEAAAATRRVLAALGERDGDRRGADRPAHMQRIRVEARGRVRYLPVEVIDYATASGPYVELHAGGHAHLIRERMHVLERRLDPERFFRVHRSAIVQLDRVESLGRRGGELVVRLRDGSELAVSRRRRHELERRLKEMP